MVVFLTRGSVFCTQAETSSITPTADVEHSWLCTNEHECLFKPQLRHFQIVLIDYCNFRKTLSIFFYTHQFQLTHYFSCHFVRSVKEVNTKEPGTKEPSFKELSFSDVINTTHKYKCHSWNSCNFYLLCMFVAQKHKLRFMPHRKYRVCHFV